MSKKPARFAVFLLGMVVGQATILAVDLIQYDSSTEMLNKYHAYRDCIPESSCKMQVEDWLRYYEIKWSLEERGILE